MRSDDEEENDYEEDEEDDEEVDGVKLNGEFDEDQFDGDEGEDDEEADGDDDDDGDGDGDDDDDEDDEDEDEDDDEDEEEDGDDDAGGEDADMAAAEVASQRSKTSARSKTSQPPSEKAASTSGSPRILPPAPHLIRRQVLVPSWTEPPSSLTIEAIVGIPLPSPVHALAASACMSYLLTGSQDGYVRAYDVWGSVNGAQIMTAQQRTVVGLGESVHKAGVGRGWWSCDVDVPDVKGSGLNEIKTEPIFSLACESDALWAVAGTQSGPINLYSLRHSPGHRIHTLTGHSSVVSALQLLPGDTGLVSGSWDGAVREWDLNTGVTTRTYPTHGAQVSSLALRPTCAAASQDPVAENGRLNVSVNVGKDFFAADREGSKDAAEAGAEPDKDANGDVEMTDEVEPKDEEKPAEGEEKPAEAKPDADANGDGDDAKSNGSNDSLFDDDDADGEEDVPMESAPASQPTPAAPAPSGFGLAIPGTSKSPATAPTTAPGSAIGTPAARLFAAPSGSSRPAVSAGAAANIPLLTATEYRSFSNDILLTSTMDGQVTLIDRRVPASGSGGVGRLMPSERAPPWCMSATWSGDGNQILAGRRNGTIDIWDVRRTASSTAPNLLRTLRTPTESGPVSSVVAFPDGRHVATASQDNIRLWNTLEYYEPEDLVATKKRGSRPPFRIIAGHHGGTISSMMVDRTGRFLVTASGDRGWQGESTKVVLIHEVKW